MPTPGLEPSRSWARSRSWRRGAWLLLGGLALGLRAVGLRAPWGADNLGTAGAFFSIAARNYFRYGYFPHRLIPVVTAEGPPSPALLYSHHPPLVPLLVSGAFSLFGEHEWAARLVPLLASMASLMLLVHLSLRAFGEQVALVTLAIAATLPLDAHLASHVDVQGSVLLASILATLSCLAHRRHGAAIVCFTVAVLTDWAALYLPVLLVVAPWPFPHARPRRLLLGLLLYAAVLFVSLASWLSSPDAILGLLHERALSFHSDQGEPFDVWQAGRLIVGTYLWQLCTPGVLAAVLLWIILRVPALLRRRDPERLALLLLLFGITHMVVGFQGARQHEFWAHYLRAGVPLAAALLVTRVAGAVPPGRGSVAVLTILLVALMLPGLFGTLRLARHPLSARMLDAGYTPRELAQRIRACTPPGAGALTADYSGESAIFFYAERPLAIGIVTPEMLEERLRVWRYDPPGGAGPPYDVPSAPPVCFILPSAHAQQFPQLTRSLRARFAEQTDGPFHIFSLTRPASTLQN